MENEELLIKNLAFLVAIYDFDSERQGAIKSFFISAFNNHSILDREIQFEDIVEFSKKNYSVDVSPEQVKKNYDEALLNNTMNDALLPILDTYIPQRYCRGRILEEFKKAHGFEPIVLAEVEKAVMVQMGKKQLGHATYQYKSNQDYLPSAIRKPDVIDIDKVIQTHSVSQTDAEAMVIRGMTMEMALGIAQSGIPYAEEMRQHLLGQTWLKQSVHAAAESLIIDITELCQIEKIESKDTVRKPIIRMKDKSLFVPFGTDLLMPHLRLEMLILDNPRTLQCENEGKGEVVEQLLPEIFFRLGARGYFRGVKYLGYESDGLLVLKDSVWIVEIKSHSILRNLFDKDLTTLKQNFVGKVTDAYRQGTRTADYLRSNKGILEFLTGQKDPPIEGVIVVVDGYLPTFFTHNLRCDQKLGTEKIYQEFSERSDRLAVFNLIDLVAISLQGEKEKFEDFLKWRTNDNGKFPILGLNERELWSFLFDVAQDPRWEGKYRTLVERECVAFYTGTRFNRKDYLQEMREEKR